MTDKRLIDANALHVYTGHIKYNTGEIAWKYVLADDVKNAPTIDAVEVVRCRECKYAFVNDKDISKPLICCKTKMVGTTDPDWFCAAGERKMDGGAR